MASLCLIFYQDFRFRAVWWLAFPVLFLSSLGFSFQYLSFDTILRSSIINIVFLLLQCMILTVYFSLKVRRLVNITKGLLGWGDILFLFCLTVVFSPLNYILFYVCSLLTVLLLSLVLLLSGRDILKRIPLAGLQSLLFAALLLYSWRFHSFSLGSDSSLLFILLR